MNCLLLLHESLICFIIHKSTFWLSCTHQVLNWLIIFLKICISFIMLFESWFCYCEFLSFLNILLFIFNSYCIIRCHNFWVSNRWQLFPNLLSMQRIYNFNVNVILIWNSSYRMFCLHTLFLNAQIWIIEKTFTFLRHMSHILYVYRIV